MICSIAVGRMWTHLTMPVSKHLGPAASPVRHRHCARTYRRLCQLRRGPSQNWLSNGAAPSKHSQHLVWTCVCAWSSSSESIRSWLFPWTWLTSYRRMRLHIQLHRAELCIGREQKFHSRPQGEIVLQRGTWCSCVFTVVPESTSPLPRGLCAAFDQSVLPPCSCVGPVSGGRSSLGGLS